MRIKIAGGCGEHGCNCFYIEGRFPVHLNFLKFRTLAMKNSFKEIIMYHSNEINCRREFVK